MKNINSASLFPSATAAWGVNNLGQVVGTGYLNSSSFHAFLYSGGKMVNVGPPGSYQASAVAINNSGRIVGGYYFTSGKSGQFLYSSGKVLFVAHWRAPRMRLTSRAWLLEPLSSARLSTTGRSRESTFPSSRPQKG
jgi:probable HAF family extracellular repeat protein